MPAANTSIDNSLLRLARRLATLALALSLIGCNRMSNAALPEAYAHPFTAQSDLALLKQDGVEVHRINVNAFNPHRDAAAFGCRHAAQTAPAFSAESQQLNEQALALTSPALWPNERNYPAAMQLWKRAMDMGNWKAGLNWIQMARTGAGVNSEKGNFQVSSVPQREVLMATNALARLGVADAFFWIGDYYLNGDGVKADSTRAWGFYELAADLGSAKAQTQLARVLVLGKREQEEPGTFEFANTPYQLTLLECAHGQGYGRASYELGSTLDVLANAGLVPSDQKRATFAHALQVLHEGTKYGNEDSANNLYSSFAHGEPLGMLFKTTQPSR